MSAIDAVQKHLNPDTALGCRPKCANHILAAFLIPKIKRGEYNPLLCFLNKPEPPQQGIRVVVDAPHPLWCGMFIADIVQPIFGSGPFVKRRWND